MFATIRSAILDRIMTARLLLTAAAGATIPRVGPTTKGLIFVQLYAAYEYAVRESVLASFVAVDGHALPMSAIGRGVLTMALDAEFTSLANVGRRSSWDRRLQLLAKATSSEVAKLQGIEFPDDGSHFRPGQLGTIWKLLGIQSPIVPQLKHLGRIVELVDNRNAIAHGRLTADQIGSRYSVDDIQQRIEDVQEISIHVVQAIEDHCCDAGKICS